VTTSDTFWRRVRYGIGVRIIAPFLLLTLVVAALGTFVYTTQATRSLSDRYTAQLIDAGRVVSEGMIGYENDRLETLRLVAGTQGVGANLVQNNPAALNDLTLPIILNNQADAVELVNMNGQEVYGWQRIPGAPATAVTPTTGNDLSHIGELQLVLDGYDDLFGDKRVVLTDTPRGRMIFTIGPVFADGEQVGAAMVGSYLDAMLLRLSQSAVARLTLYDQSGQVVETTLSGQDAISLPSLAADPAEYATIRQALQQNPERYAVVATKAESEVPLQEVEVLGQSYRLAFGDWRLRGQSLGLFSVAVPTDFVSSPLLAGRNQLVMIFTVAFFAVFLIGLWVTKRITDPVYQLVATATAVGEGDLQQRSGINRPDEIGQLAGTLDLMTARLESRTQALLRQTSELQTILNNITDGVLLLDADEKIVTSNLAARQLLADLSYDFFATGPLREIAPLNGAAEPPPPVVETAVVPQLKRFQIGDRVLTTLATEVLNPDGQQFGTVIVLRDITREVEADNLKDAFITTISHELRTPLTIIKVYADLLLKTGGGQFDDRQLLFVRNIQKGSLQLEQHINQLIHISEIQAGTIKLDRQKVPLTNLAQQAVENWRTRLESKGITLTLQLDAPDACVLIDPTHMGWAIESLLSNAHNYTEGGGRVSLRVAQNQTDVYLSVTDTGIGIATADQPYLFNRFFRAQNSINYEMRGVGLGLFVARSVVELHQGHITVKSELGQGSTFTISLPRVEA
jgi:signal transduction histidine kinase/HAMP domain-containing protein